MSFKYPEGKITKDMVKIYQAGLETVKPYHLIRKKVKLHNNLLIINNDNTKFSVNLDDFNRIFVLGAGKATASMAKAVEDILGLRIEGGIISVKYGYTEKLKYIKIIEAGHPIPDKNSLKAALEIEELAKSFDEKTLVINLISGGGSSLLTHPLDFVPSKKSKISESGISGKDKSYNKPAFKDSVAISLEDLQKTTEVLLASGATIDEINCIRKHISAIKGGRLAELIYPAYQVNLILSDVIGDRIDSIASGLTTWDNTTYLDALKIIKKYSIMDKIPETVLKIIELGLNGSIPETPKKGAEIFNRVKNIVIGSNSDALKEAYKKAVELGYSTYILTSRITGESKEIAKILCGIALDIRNKALLTSPPACIIGGGETTVTIRGSGKGGRNQEMALSFLSQLFSSEYEYDNIYFLSASTDGSDGPTDATGAFSTPELIKKAKNLGIDPWEYLQNNNSYEFFSKIGGLLITGPTNTNVCDIQVIIVT